MMRKIIALAVTVICALTLMCVTVSGENTDFSVDVIADGYVKTGDTVNVTVKVHEIKSGVALNAVSFELEYDTSMFEYVSGQCATTLDGWDLPQPTHSGNLLEFNLTDDSSDFSKGVGSNGSISYTLTFKIKADSSETGKISVTFASGASFSSGGVGQHTGKLGEKSFSLIKTLPAPQNLALSSEGVASWDAVANATSYKVQLYFDGEKAGNVVTVTSPSHNFESELKKNLGGSYTFKVYAVSSDAGYSDSAEAESSELKYQGTLSAPEISFTAVKISGKIKYTITDTNPEDTVSVYVISIYKKDGTLLKEIDTNSLNGEISGLTVNEEYDFTVKAEAQVPAENSSVGNFNSGESSKKSFKVVGIESISVSKKPTLTYIEGDALNLSSMEVTVKYTDGTKEAVKKDKFSTYGITVTPAHGADLTLSMNGKEIKVAIGSIFAPERLVLTVEAGLCPHESTEEEHRDPTCGADGYDNLVCKVCGVVVRTVLIPSTNDHSYGEWTWINNKVPSVQFDGQRKRTCSKCNGEEIDTVTYAEYLVMIGGNTSTPDSTPEESTTPSTTEPENDPPRRQNDALGGLIGKLLLGAVLAIFFVIILFVVLAVWLESRQNRRRKSQARVKRNRTTRPTGTRPPNTTHARNAQTRNTYNRGAQNGNSRTPRR